MITYRLIVLSFIMIFLTACEDRGSLVESEFSLPEDVANSYLTFLNPQQEFSSDVYQLVIVPSNAITEPSEIASYQITLNSHLDSPLQTYQGEWQQGSLLDQTNTTNRHALDLREQEVGRIQVMCSIACELFLIKDEHLYQHRIAADDFSIDFQIQTNQLNSVESVSYTHLTLPTIYSV